MKFFLAKILIASGHPINDGTTVEIIDLINPKFKFAYIDPKIARRYPVGGVLQDQILFCGGNIGREFLQDCIIFGQDRKNYFHFLLEKRFRASSIVVNNNNDEETSLLWITGGWPRKKSSELVYLDKPPRSGIVM